MLCFGAPAVRADDVPDAATLLDRVQKADGTTPDNVRSVIRRHGSDGDTVETIYRSAKNVRRVWTDGPITSESGTYGSDDWTRDENGLTVLDEPDPDTASDDDVAPVVTRRHAPDAYVIERLGKNGYGTRTFIDPATYRVMRDETIRATGTTTTTYTAYQTYGTATVATKWTTSDSATSTSTDYERTEYAIGAVTPADLQPAPPRKIFTLPDNVSQAVLPTDFDGGEILVHADIAGHRSDFILDTGAAGISITEGKAKQLGLTTYNPRRNDANAGAYIEREAIIPKIQIGPVALHDVVVTIIPSVGDTDNVGLLGFDFLAELGVRIDYEQQRVTVIDPAHFVPPTDKNVFQVDVRLGSLQPMTSVVFDGERADRMIVDTGAAGTFMLQDHFTSRHPRVLHTRAVSSARFTGVGGDFNTDSWRMKHIKWGTDRLHEFHRLPRHLEAKLYG